MVINETQQQRILQMIRDGHDAGAAARAAGTTAVQIHKTTNPHNQRHYNETFAEAYREAMGERDQTNYSHQPAEGVRGETPRTTPQGYLKWRYLEPEQVDQFIEDLENGYPRILAAERIGTSITQINRLASNDQGFRDRYDKATKAYDPALRERIHAEHVRQAFEEGNYAALKDLGIIRDPDQYERLRTSKHEIGGPDGGAIRILQASLTGATPELLAQIQHELEARIERKAIEQ